MFYMVYVEGSQGCRHQHLTDQEAKTEAERLARLPENRNKSVYVMQSTEFVICPDLPVSWHQEI
jgi:hypothetical protein